MKKTNLFAKIPVKGTPYTTFDKSHEFLYTSHFGRISPIDWEALAPGESYSIREGVKLLSSPYFAPQFSRITNKTRYFAVPVRKLVPYWDKYVMQNPDDGLLEPYTTVGDLFCSAYLPLQPGSTGNLITLQAMQPGGLGDMLGWPDFYEQLLICVTGVDRERYAEILGEFPASDDVFAEFWQTLLGELPVDADYEEKPLSRSFDSYNYLGDGKWDLVKDGFKAPAFFGQRLRLLPFLAFQKVIFDWFLDLRFLDDQFTLVNSYFETTAYVGHLSTYTYSGDDSLTGQDVTVRMLPFLLADRTVDYAKDYFTTASPQPQMGPELVIGPERLPLMFDVTQQTQPAWGFPGTDSSVEAGDSGRLRLVTPADSEDEQALLGEVWAQVNEADEITPIKLRWQMALQSILERRNSAGNRRYTDFVLGQYGIRVPDPYLQRSYYLGGWSQDINTNEVVALADGADAEGNSSMLADIGGFGRNYRGGPLVRARVANEHVVILGLSYIVPQNYYTQGLATRLTDTEVLQWPMWQLAKVGEQPIYNRELFFGDSPDEIFGYNRRFSDKVDRRDEVHGEFRTTLQYWHTGRKFTEQPRLGSSFLPLRGSDGHNRILAVDPSVAEPFRLIRYKTVRHRMAIPRV